MKRSVKMKNVQLEHCEMKIKFSKTTIVFVLCWPTTAGLVVFP